jgi:glycosyltransferase involved in cell wall biosynthesis
MISVIMLTYNREQYVRNMIEDILGQTYIDFEYIIIDNGSTDASGKIADEYARNDKRIKVIHLNESKSIGYARNLGLKKSIGEYIAYVDDDDRVEPDFLKFLMSLIEEHNADISMCGATEGDGTTRNPQCLFDEKMVLTGEEALRLLLGRKYIRAGMPTKLYKREILEKYPFVENYKNEDIHTQYKYLLSGKIIVIYGIDKYYFARHAGNISGFTSNAGGWDAKTMNDYLTAFHNRTDFVKQYAPNTYKLALYSEWSFMISMVEKIDRYGLEDCKVIGDKLIETLTKHKEEFLKMPEIKDFEKSWIERYVG